MQDIELEQCCTCHVRYLVEDIDTVESPLDFKQRRQCRHCSGERIESWDALAAWCDDRPTHLDPWKEAEELGLDAAVRFYVAGRILPCRKAIAAYRKLAVVALKPPPTEDELAKLYAPVWDEAHLENDRRDNQELFDEWDPEFDGLLKETLKIAERSPVVVSLKKERNARARKAFWGGRR